VLHVVSPLGGSPNPLAVNVNVALKVQMATHRKQARRTKENRAGGIDSSRS
jgi:hypothetical protein